MKTGFLLLEDDSVRLYTVKGQGGNLRIENRMDFRDVDSIKAPASIESFYLSLPLSHLNFRLMEMPFSDREKLREVLPYELQGLVLNVDGILYDPIVLSGNGGKYNVLVPYIARERLKGLIGKLKAKGIDPEVVTSLELAGIRKEFTPRVLREGVDLSEEEIEGLIIEEVEEPTINLRRGELSFSRNSEENSRLLHRLSYLTGILLLVLSINFAVQWYGYRKGSDSVTSSMNTLYKNLFPDETKIVDPAYQLRAHIKELKTEAEQIRGVSALAMLSTISESWIKGVVLEELTINSGLILLKGESESLKDVEILIESLKKRLKDVELAGSKTTVSGRLAFSIKAKRGEPDLDKPLKAQVMQR